MRRDVYTLRDFYAGPLGALVREAVSRKLIEAWGDGRGMDVLGVGYATPFLTAFGSEARRVVAAMPATQGAELWPAGRANRVALAAEDALPFTNALFDRVLLAHGLEESPDALALLGELHRVMAPSGRVVVVAAARRGMWSRAEHTPFGHGRPFTRTQLEQLLREAELEPTAWSRALFAPPVAWLSRWPEPWEQAGPLVFGPFAGLVMIEAVKRTFAPTAKAVVTRARPARPSGVLQPAGATRDR